MTNLVPGEFIHVLGDTHIYSNHIDPLKIQMDRTPQPFPILNIKYDEKKKIDQYTLDDFELIGYNPLSTIKMNMAV